MHCYRLSLALALRIHSRKQRHVHIQILPPQTPSGTTDLTTVFITQSIFDPTLTWKTGDREMSEYQLPRVLVVTGDRDLFQLVDDATEVQVLNISKGVAKLEVMDDAAIQAKYNLPGGRAYADFAVLRGDPAMDCPAWPASARRPPPS